MIRGASLEGDPLPRTQGRRREKRTRSGARGDNRWSCLLARDAPLSRSLSFLSPRGPARQPKPMRKTIPLVGQRQARGSMGDASSQAEKNRFWGSRRDTRRFCCRGTTSARARLRVGLVGGGVLVCAGICVCLWEDGGERTGTRQANAPAASAAAAAAAGRCQPRRKRGTTSKGYQSITG